ncbi:hypothetical protein pb186bvf_006543 [Paramecium bursaria]
MHQYMYFWNIQQPQIKFYMNSLLCLDPTYMLQQQLMLQQMIIYNSMLLGTIKNLTQPSIISQQLSTSTTLQSDNKLQDREQAQIPNLYPQNQTKQTESIKQLPSIVKPIQKQLKKKEDQKPKKKIFLSMMDIKNIQYKTFKEIDLRLKDKQETSSEIQ